MHRLKIRWSSFSSFAFIHHHHHHHHHHYHYRWLLDAGQWVLYIQIITDYGRSSSL